MGCAKAGIGAGHYYPLCRAGCIQLMTLFLENINSEPGSWVSSVCMTTWNSICLVFFALFSFRVIYFRVNCGSLSSLRCYGCSWRGQDHLITFATSALED